MSQRSREVTVDPEGLPKQDSESRPAKGEIRHIKPASAGSPDTAPQVDAHAATDTLAETAAPVPEPREDLASLAHRVGRLERHNRWLRYALILALVVGGYGVFDKVFPEGVIIQKTMMESKELKLLDNEGNARLFLRMYSRVPVLQIVDNKGKPRLSLGLRFDDTPFIDLSDKRGNTRATLEMTEQDAPALRLFDEQGDITFKIN